MKSLRRSLLVTHFENSPNIKFFAIGCASHALNMLVFDIQNNFQSPMDYDEFERLNESITKNLSLFAAFKLSHNSRDPQNDSRKICKYTLCITKKILPIPQTVLHQAIIAIL